MAQDAFVGPLIEKEPGGDVMRVKQGGALYAPNIERKTITVSVASCTAGTASTIIDQVASPVLAATIKSVKLMTGSSISGHATSNFTMSLRNVGTGATGTTDVATLALTTGNAVTANVAKAFSVSATGAASIAAGENLVYYATLASSGLDVPKGKLMVEFETVATQ